METKEKIELLYAPDSSISYKNLLELEQLSEKENTLYPYFDTFLEMTASDKYVLRVRGFRLLCKQAKWDVDNKLLSVIDILLARLIDEKPTALRQYLKALQEVVLIKKELHPKIRKRVL